MKILEVWLRIVNLFSFLLLGRETRLLMLLRIMLFLLMMWKFEILYFQNDLLNWLIIIFVECSYFQFLFFLLISDIGGYKRLWEKDSVPAFIWRLTLFKNPREGLTLTITFLTFLAGCSCPFLSLLFYFYFSKQKFIFLS